MKSGRVLKYFVMSLYLIPYFLTSEIAISYEGVPAYQMSTAKIIFETVASVLGKSALTVISKNVNFYEIGGNSLNSINTICELKAKGCYIGEFDETLLTEA